MTINEAFEDLLTKQINISQAQREQGSKSHNYIRGLLENKWQTHNAFPWIIEGDFLSGSYARGTKIYPLDDIDVMIVLDGHGLRPISNGYYLDATVRGGGHDGSPINMHFDANGLVSSLSVLGTFERALKETFPDSPVRKDEQCVNVWLESYGLGLDIVPCFHIVPNNGAPDYYYIPKGNGDSNWKSTNPKLDHQISDGLHVYHNRRLKPIVKILKYWNREQNADRLRSYHLEALAWKVFRTHPNKIADHASGVRYFFEKAATELLSYCPDPTGLGDSIDKYLSGDDRQATILKMNEAVATVGLLGAFLNSNVQMQNWRKVMGQRFGQ